MSINISILIKKNQDQVYKYITKPIKQTNQKKNNPSVDSADMLFKKFIYNSISGSL